MKGKVVGLKKDLCAVQISSGLTIFEIIDIHSTEIKDIMSGNLENVGSETLNNETKEEDIDVFIEDWGCSQEIADDFLCR